MALTGIKSKPILRGTVISAGPWQALFALQGLRVYPFQMGAAVRLDSVGTTAYTHGLGEFNQNDYFMLCRPTYYGESALYIPVPGSISRVTSNPLSASDDALVISPAISMRANDWLLNLGADSSSSPLQVPNYDGSRIDLFSDPVGNNALGLDYFTTGQGGQFQGWIEDGYNLVDLLVTNSSGEPMLVIPSVAPGPGVV